MNRKQKMIKQMAKRAKARDNKKEKPNPSSKPKERYISKAERAKLEALESPATEAAPETTDGDDTPASAPQA